MAKKTTKTSGEEKVAAGLNTPQNSQVKIKVLFLRNPAEFKLCYYKGDEAEINEALAKELIEAKVAEQVK